MKLKSLKLAVAVALAAPMLLASGGVMAATCVGDELPNCDDAVVQINEDVRSATDVQVSTTEWSGETSVATGSTPSGLAAGIGGIRAINLMRIDTAVRSAECASTSPYYNNNCRFDLSTNYMNQSIQQKIGDSNTPHIAAKNYPSSAGDDPERHTVFGVGAVGFNATELEYEITFSSAVDSNDGGTPNFKIILKQNDSEKANYNCNFTSDGSKPSSGNGCWWTHSGTKLHYIFRDQGKNQIDTFDLSGEGGNFNNGRYFRFTNVKLYANNVDVANIAFPTDLGE
jgi:hypothetical protein